MIKTQTRTIDGVTVEVTQLPAMRASKLLVRIGAIAGPAIGKLATLAGKGQGVKVASLGDVDLDKVGDALTVLFDKLTPSEFESLCRELLSSSKVSTPEPAEDGGTGGALVEFLPVFDRVMQGRVSVLLKILAFSFEVNYGDFFVAFRGIVSRLPRTVATA